MKKILIVIDMQNDFIDGSLGTKEAVAIVENVKDKIRSYPKENIYATRDSHQKNYLETQEGQNLPVAHCIKGTKGWRVHKEIQALLRGAKIINKPTFGSVTLAKKLAKENKAEQLEIELVGLCTDICVISNALLLKAFMPEVRISVDANCCAGVTPEKHAAALETMKSCQIQVTESPKVSVFRSNSGT
ncbi:MAG: cysteine hydrolase [Treponema sp.]|nr:cysteine hydrolase [Treponema sp.]